MTQAKKERPQIFMQRRELAPERVAMFGQGVAFKIGDAEFVLVAQQARDLEYVWRRLFGNNTEHPLDFAAIMHLGLMRAEELRAAQWPPPTAPDAST